MTAGRAPAAAARRSSGQPGLLWPGWLLLVTVLSLLSLVQMHSAYVRFGRSAPGKQAALESSYITASGYAAYHVALDLLFVAFCWTTAALVLRRTHDRHAVIAAVVLTFWSATNGLAFESVLSLLPWTWPFILGGWSGLCYVFVSNTRAARRESPLLARQRARWHSYGTGSALVLMLLTAATAGFEATLGPDDIDRHMTGHLLQLFAGALFPIGMLTAWNRPAPPDPDTLLRRTLVYGGLTSVVLLANITLIMIPAFLYPEFAPVYALPVVTAVTLLGLPLYRFMQRAVDRRLYGQRGEPLQVLDELGQRLELGSPETVLGTMAESVATALKLPAVAIFASTDDSAPLAQAGTSPLEPVVLPIVHHGETVGSLAAWPRARDEALSDADIDLLRLIARQSGPTVQAVQLTQELRRSRQQILSGREEERRRIRRDLHDGLGPSLAALVMQADTALAVLDDDPASARELMAAVTHDLGEVVQDIRRLVYDLRPPALDELGLAGSIERLARQHTSATLDIRLHAPPAMPALPAAVEVAIYRIVAEALTNVVRHARASRCTIDLALDASTVGTAISVTITDDGRGLDATATPGIGLASMRERASELGGELSISAPPTGGTILSVTFTAPAQDPAE